ncbi:FAST kinase domain-containing protein 4 [Amyelois transitella]|uniref:FAST kinase domain-containing protein 4 n=1 Tax=Amyelois transitella TaxID=680683 RepID=UPI00298F5BC7|nr:FAST kinase domain-containing protein 4 [Amyelois transitella]XP_060802176.1 FAST kinase domain-containing protein 4 [Amyelois transitella]
MLKYSGSFILRLSARAFVRKYSSPGASVFRNDKLDGTGGVSDSQAKSLSEDDRGDIGSKGLVAAAFASLNNPDTEDKRKPSLKSVKQSKSQQMDMQITKATDVNSLLVVAENSIVSRRHALKMVSILSEWSSSNKVKLGDFEKDPRFLKLCRILARTPTAQAMSSLTMAEDLSTVLGITGDDEAARLISNLTLPQMIKVMKVLQQKGRRSTPLLRALSHNITKNSEVIDLKKSADLLYSMVSLNFPDPVLLDRICKDVIECLPSNEDRPAAVSSITVSLGLLKYRHEAALAALCGWSQARAHAGCAAAAVVTLAQVDFVPPNTEKLFEVALSLKENEMSRASAWLDLVFSLLILDRAEPHHLTTTLQPDFIDKLLSAGEIPIPARRKLMTIDAYVGMTLPAHSPRLPEDIWVGVPLAGTREKAAYVQSVMDTFKSLVSADAFLRRGCNSGMGFLYDAEFAVDAKCHPVLLEKAVNNKSVFRIAVLCLDYHDMTRRAVVPLGVYQLYTRMLQLKGFKVLQIPYTEYNPKDKLVTRVQYIEKKLKNLIKS